MGSGDVSESLRLLGSQYSTPVAARISPISVVGAEGMDRG
jgi:hypothetical protein